MPATALYKSVNTNVPYALNIGGATTNDGDILVTASFVKMLQRILLLRSKSTFLTFLLAQLLSFHQVVLLVSSTSSHLFFQGKVYVRRPSSSSSSSQHQHMPYSGFHFLPIATHTHRALHLNPYPIWALINANAHDSTPDSAIAIPTNCNVWPVQACPPDGPLRYGRWRKQRRGCLWGMSLWSEEEVLAGLSLQPTYAQFRSDLEEALHGQDDPALRTAHMIDTLKLLRPGLDFKSKSGSKSESESIDKALQILLHNAIREFGPIPRDVYTAVLSSSSLSSLSSLSSAHQSHSKTLETLTLERLHRLVLTFAHESKLESGAEHILAIIPREGEGVPKLDAWDIRFKSGRIAGRMSDKVLDKVLSEEEEEDTSINIDGSLWAMFRSFRKVRAGCTMARWVFSMIGHRTLCAPSRNSGFVPIRMTPDSNSSSNPNPNPNTPPNLFSTQGSCGRTINIPTSETPHDLYDIITREEGRKPVRIDLSLGNRNTNNTITLDDTKYYIPTNTVDDEDPDSLFDSFMVQRDGDMRTIWISVFRFTILSSSASDARPQSASARGYEEIRRIVGRVRKLVEEMPTEAGGDGMSRKRKASESVDVEMKIKVVYFLVHPGSESTMESQSQPVSWQMPDGWTDDRTEGEVFSLCLQIPDPVAP
ncbi:uncharacterized protein STEHIDRAFT_164408 [Stereum hirsutum FP-91666 SS1]|uniref:uncharacterized protein n=1 Tax=Stereum hirsutum (strain FP-91666) TaxID=721885 RepID=UPI000440A99A|nr:uncharacterized protein STEHIDRAFT_164408 [Stereum hirsutum FP-91666 SS1]EIM92051.1 hypothetical protein STEHIDRAFT_164408 [Stereum hirsutum FP-91666 SS1]